jgi:hypothetical protein
MMQAERKSPMPQAMITKLINDAMPALKNMGRAEIEKAHRDT